MILVTLKLLHVLVIGSYAVEFVVFVSIREDAAVALWIFVLDAERRVHPMLSRGGRWRSL
jgi:hypothetical protein